jgi:hypothetical protein
MAHAYIAQLDALVAALTAKGFHNAHADLTLRDSGNSFSPFSVDVDYKVKADSLTTYLHVRQLNLEDGAGIDDAFEEMRRKIAELPTIREQEIKEFVNLMERLKTSAEDLGLDVDFVNPLMAIMEKLASNALPAPKG